MIQLFRPEAELAQNSHSSGCYWPPQTCLAACFSVCFVGRVKGDHITKVLVFSSLTSVAPEYAPENLCFRIKIHVKVKVLVACLAFSKKLKKFL